MKLARLVTVLVLLAVCAQPALADRDKGGKRGGGKGGKTPSNEQSRGISSARAAEIARKKTGGRVLAVKPSSKGYRVKVLTPSGEVRYVKVPRR